MDNSAAFIGFGNEAPAIRKFGRAGTNFSRDHEDRDAGPATMHESCKIKPVQLARHLNVGEDHTHVIPFFEPRDGLVSSARLNDLEVDLLQL